MKNCLLILILLLSMLFIFPAPNQAQALPVIAFYYAWFDETTWTSGKPADLPLTPYRSADPALIEHHVVQAKGAGITAFVQSWYGPQVENNQTEPNFATLLDTAARHGFQAAVDFEVLSPFFGDLGAVQNGLTTLLATHIHHPAYLRYQGKPVIFFWRQQAFSISQWANMRAALDPNRTTYWIAEGTDLSFQEVFDGHHLYSIAWSGNVQAELNKWPPRIQQVEDRLGVDKLWVATVMPGYDDLRLGRGDSFSRDRQGGAFYRQTWNAAISSQPDMIVITSFNEWLEGTHIEPSQAYGDYYLNLTRELITSASTVGPPPSSDPPVPAQPSEPSQDLSEGSTAALVIESPITESEAAEITTKDNVISSPPIDRQAFLTPSIDGTKQIYTVQAGDSLWAIALAFDIDVDDIIAANNIDDPNKLDVGQALIMPLRSDIALTEQPGGESSFNQANKTSSADIILTTAATEVASSIVDVSDTLPLLSEEVETLSLIFLESLPTIAYIIE